MKRLIISSLAVTLALPVCAQSIRQATPVDAAFRAAEKSRESATVKSPLAHGAFDPQAKTSAATPFYTDTFRSTSIGAGGWTTGGNTGNRSWTIATTGTNYMSGLQSTTRAGGYLRYDAFSIATAFPNNNPQIGHVTSPSINCTGHNFVGVRFQQYVRRLADSFFVDVSNDDFATSTRFPVYPNNTVAGNQSTANPQITTINITSVAANQANVKVRFVYSGHYTGAGTSNSGGTYGWQVDDFQLVDLDQVDLAVENSITMRLDAAGGYMPMGTAPAQFADSVTSWGYVTNLGGTAQSNVNVTTQVVAAAGGASLFNKSVVFNNIAVNGFDSLADFRPQGGFKTTALGTYYSIMNVAATGDGDISNNTDTLAYSVSDSSLAAFSGYVESSKVLNPFYSRGGYYVHRTATATNDVFSYYYGSFFEVPAGKNDTVTSITFGMHPVTAAGQTVQFEIYRLNPAVGTTPAFWTYQNARTVAKTLTANDIAVSGNLRLATAPLEFTAQRRYFVPTEGIYAAVMRPVNPTADIVILTAQCAASPKIVGNYGVSDTADGSPFSFAALFPNGSNYRTSETVPVVVVNFGNSAALGTPPNTSVGNVAVTVGNAYPNPANTTFSIPVTATSSKNVSVSLSNMLGQVVKTQTLGNMGAGQTKTAVFNTSDIASGVYNYTVEANGERVNGRVVISH